MDDLRTKKPVKGIIVRDSYLILVLNSNDLDLLQIFVMAGLFVVACVGFEKRRLGLSSTLFLSH